MGIMNAMAIAGFEPQAQNRYLFRVGGLSDSDIIELAASAGTAFLPNESSEEVELPYLNGRAYYAGRQSYESGTIGCKDFVDLAVAKAIMEWRKLVYDPETGRMGYASRYKKDAEIILLDPAGEEKRYWTLVGAWPQAVNYGTLDVTANDPVQIEVTIRYDIALPTKLTI
jgi:hypothetical protein